MALTIDTLEQLEAVLILIDKYKTDIIKIGDITITKSKHDFGKVSFNTPPSPDQDLEAPPDSMFFAMPKPASIQDA
jgi:hypothetical protein